MWESWLSTEQAVAVDALAARAAAIDGFDPLNEEARLSRTSGQMRHLLADQDGELVGYLVHSPIHQTAQLVVDPDHRRRGIGSQLAATLAADAPLRLWAFHDASPAQGFVRKLGLVEGRALLVMEKGLPPIPEVAQTIARGVGYRDPRGVSTSGVSREVHSVSLEGSGFRDSSLRSNLSHRPMAHPAMADAGLLGGSVALRPFTAADAEALLAVNAAAFAHHPEQGGLDAAGLAARMGEEWFDPDGLIVAVENDRMLGFHWTKKVGDLGEVYVIGVDPAAQGRGLGRRLLAAGLDHLAKTGCRSVILYVDSADTVAVGMYLSAGFGVAHRDVLYVPASEEQQ